MLTRTGETIKPINLAHFAPFRLGDVEVHPATRQLSREGASETIEPRVMQVLVALAQADGGVVTRDELTDLCWDGRIVSEHAINRVVSRVRQIAAEFATGSFQLETITKVGYRLVPCHPPASPQAKASQLDEAPTGPAATGVSRRTWLLGAGAGALLSAGGLFFLSRPRDPLPEAVALFQRAQSVREGGPGVAEEQVIALLREATRLDPNYADAWGALALAYALAATWETRSDRAAMIVRARATTARALALSPTNPDARLAPIYLTAHYRRWAEVEKTLRAIAADHPDHGPTRANLANLLNDVGRLQEGIEWLQPLAGADQFIPLARYRFIYALWSAGRIDEAEAALDSASARWPKHGAIWQARVKFLAHTGRPSAALALVQDASARPIGYEPKLRDDLAVIAALQTGKVEDVDHAIEVLLDFDDPMSAANAMQYSAALGRTDTAFDLAHGHYLGRGTWAHTMPPEDGPTSPGTSLLFNPLTASMRRDPRFPALMRDIGLAAYWRQVGQLPDYLRHS